MKRRRDTQFLDEHGFLVTEIQTANGVHHLKQRNRLQSVADEAKTELENYQTNDISALFRFQIYRISGMLVNWFKWIVQELARFIKKVREQLKNHLHTITDDTDSPPSMGRIHPHIPGAPVAGNDSAKET